MISVSECCGYKYSRRMASGMQGAWFWMQWTEKSSLRRGHLSKKLKEVRGKTLCLPQGRGFQVTAARHFLSGCAFSVLPAWASLSRLRVFTAELPSPSVQPPRHHRQCSHCFSCVSVAPLAHVRFTICVCLFTYLFLPGDFEGKLINTLGSPVSNWLFSQDYGGQTSCGNQ